MEEIIPASEPELKDYFVEVIRWLEGRPELEIYTTKNTGRPAMRALPPTCFIRHKHVFSNGKWVWYGRGPRNRPVYSNVIHDSPTTPPQP